MVCKKKYTPLKTIMNKLKIKTNKISIIITKHLIKSKIKIMIHYNTVLENIIFVIIIF